MLKFGQKEVTTKDFYGQRQITDIFTIDVNTLVVSDTKLKMWKEHIKTNVHGQDVPYGMYCNATGVLKIDSVYKQGKNYHPQTYVEECKCTNAEKQQCSMLSDDDDDGLFEM